MRNDFLFIGFSEDSQNYTPEIGQSCSILPYDGRDDSLRETVARETPNSETPKLNAERFRDQRRTPQGEA